jgi:hypothetical protein
VRKPPAFFTELGPPTSVTAEVEQKEEDSMSAWSEDLRFAQQAGVAVDVRLFDGQHYTTGVAEVDEENEPVSLPAADHGRHHHPGTHQAGRHHQLDRDGHPVGAHRVVPMRR